MKKRQVPWGYLLAGGGGLIVLLMVLMTCLWIYFVVIPSQMQGAAEYADLGMTKVLTEAATNYKIDNDEWPPNLEALTLPKPNGGPPYIDASALKPKTGVRYYYDPSGPHNNGLRPDIWVDTPHGPVGNWMATPPPR
jgi:hypothetical protein